MNGLVDTPFKLSFHEILCSAAATMCLQGLEKHEYQTCMLSEVCSSPQYGFTASASLIPSGVRLVRITDIKEGFIDWNSVPFCDCAEPESYELHPNDILIARAGSVGKSFIVDKVPEKAIFASYMIRLQAKSNFSPMYVYWCLQSQQFWQQIMDAQRGSAMKNINGHMISLLKFPMPPLHVQETISLFLGGFKNYLKGLIRSIPQLSPFLEEQQHIITRVEVFAAKINELRSLRQQLLTDYDNLCRAFIFDANNDCVYTPMRELVRLRESDIPTQPEEQYHFAGVYCFGKGVFQGQRRFGTEFAYDRLTRLRVDNFVYPKLMAWEGALAVVPPECDGLVVSPEFPVFEINPERVLPETLDVYFRTPLVWPILSGVSTGTNVRRKRLNPSDFLAFKFPLPSMQKQQQLRRIKQKVDILKSTQAKTSEKLDTMLPSILDKAFKREL